MPEGLSVNIETQQPIDQRVCIRTLRLVWRPYCLHHSGDNEAVLHSVARWQQRSPAVDEPQYTVQITTCKLNYGRFHLRSPTQNKIALTTSTETFTYGELNEHANRLASGIIQHQTQQGKMLAASASQNMQIGLAIEEEKDLIIAMLATLKCGATCVPINLNSSLALKNGSHVCSQCTDACKPS